MSLENQYALLLDWNSSIYTMFLYSAKAPHGFTWRHTNQNRMFKTASLWLQTHLRLLLQSKLAHARYAVQVWKCHIKIISLVKNSISNVCWWLILTMFLHNGLHRQPEPLISPCILVSEVWIKTFHCSANFQKTICAFPCGTIWSV